MVKLVRWGATWLLVTCLALVAGLPGGPPVAYAAPEPAGCTVAEAALSMTVSALTAHLGETVTFRTRINNAAPDNCDLANMTITLTTPDGTAHQVASNLYVQAGTVTPWYDVAYTIAAGHLANNEVVATAVAQGVSRLNDRGIGGNASSSVRVAPAVGALTICSQGAGPTTPAQITVSGTTTDVPAGAQISVDVDGDSVSTAAAQDGTWSATLPWDGTGGSATLTASVSFGDGNSGSATTTATIAAVQLNGGESVTSASRQPVLSGTTTGTAVTVTIGAVSLPAVVTGGTWSLAWPTPLAYDSYVVTASVDGACATDTQALTIRNTEPAAADDAYSTAEDTPLNVAAPGVLANDRDDDGDTIMAGLVGGPTHGTLTFNSDGSFRYEPAPNFSGTDTFRYIANDASSESNVATVTITVGTANDPPTAESKEYTTDEDTPLVVAVPGLLRDAADPDGDTLTSVKTSDPSHGSVSVNPDGSFTYTPAPNYNGPDSFSFMVSDGTLHSDENTVAIYVYPVNDAPVAVNDAYSVNEGATLTLPAPGVLANDTDVEGQPLTASVKTFPANGSLGMGPDGSLTYTPANGFAATDTFTYAASDGTDESNAATVTITVNRVVVPPPPPPPPPDPNRQPFANPDSYVVDEDGTLTVQARGVMLNDTDPDGDPLSAQLFSGPAKGTLALQANGSFVYTPVPLFHGTDSFKYRVSDGQTVSNVATVTITVRHVNHPPVATDDAYSVNQGAALTVQGTGVLGNDSDVDKDTLTALLVSGPAHGTLSLNADGSFQYTPTAGYHGPDTFRYQAFDGVAKSNIATAQITVRPGDPPVAVKPAISGVVIAAATGQVIAGATVAVSADFDGDGAADFTQRVETGADGRYKIEVPRSEWTYTAIVSTPVTTAAGAMTVVTSHTTVVPKSDQGGVYNAERKIAGQIYLQAGPEAQVMMPHQVLDKGVKITATLLGQNGTVGQVTVNEQGLFEATGMPPGTYKVAVKVTAPDGTALAGTTIGAAVTGDGELVVGSALINPGSRIFDAVTKLPVDDVTVMLYWADTPLNKLKGRTPDSLVSLPVVPVFLPGMNAVPALSAGGGIYAWLVHPDGDYYIVAEKNGYRTFDSRAGGVLHVDAGLLKYDFEMEPVHARFIRGYPDGTFKPEQSITRAEVAAILARIVQPTKVELPAPPFSDLPAGHWASTYIELVRQKGLMQGDPSGTFRPDAPITRAELAMIITRFRNLTLDAPNPFADTTGHWAEAAISAAYRIGLITGYPDGTFQPQALSKRAEAATMINRMLGRGPLSGRTAPTWPDVPFDHWASGQVEEASSSHSAVRGEHQDEHWTGDTGVETW